MSPYTHLSLCDEDLYVCYDNFNQKQETNGTGDAQCGIYLLFISRSRSNDTWFGNRGVIHKALSENLVVCTTTVLVSAIAVEHARSRCMHGHFVYMGVDHAESIGKVKYLLHKQVIVIG